MAVNIKLKRSAVPGNVPSTTQLELGEIALNTFDGRAFFKKDDGTQSIVELASTSSTVATASYALYAELAGTASVALNAISSSYALSASYSATATSASYALSSSNSVNTISASYALSASFASTSSYASNFNVSGNLVVGGDITAKSLHVQTVTSSVIYSSGSNIFGDATNDTQTLIGTVNISGSLNVTGSAVINDLTGSLYGTASWALDAITAINAPRYTLTSSFQNFTQSYYADSASVSTRVVNLEQFSASILNYTASNDAKISSIYLATASLNFFSASILSYTASTDAKIDAIYLATASLNAFSASILNYTSSTDAKIASIYNATSSLQGATASLNLATASLNAQTASLLNYTASTDAKITSIYNATSSLQSATASLNDFSASILNYTSSNNANIASLNAQTASLLLVTASLNAFSASILNYTSSTDAKIASIYNATSSLQFATSSLNAFSASMLAFTASHSTGSFTGSFRGEFTGSFSGSLNNLQGTARHIPFFSSSQILDDSSMYQVGDSSVAINQNAVTTAAPEALYVWQPSTSSFNVISGKGNLDTYLQLNIQNTNQGTSASSDIVATANNGNEFANYINMGINSENFSGFLGGPNDAYVYAAGNEFHIGNITPNKHLGFFVGGGDVDAGNKFALYPNNQHQMTGSLDVSGSVKAFSFTGSLLGTASFANNTTSASYAFNATSASYAITASHALNVPDTASFAISASYAATASFVSGAVYTSGNQTIDGLKTFTDNTSFNKHVLLEGSGSDNYMVAWKQRTAFGSTLLNPGNGYTGMGAFDNYRLQFYFNQGGTSFKSFAFNIGNVALGDTVGLNIPSTGGTLLVSNLLTGSVATASLALNTQTAQTASLALTASSADNFLVRGTLTAQTIVAQTITSSVSFITGSTKFGTITSNTHQFTGSVSVSGSLAANGSNVILTNQTSSMSVLSASFASSGTGNFSGSFSGSFFGSGAGLTNISASSVVGLNLSQIASGSVTASVDPNGFKVNSNATISGSTQITGSLGVTGSVSITGSGTILSANVDTISFTGSFAQSGSVTVVGSVNATSFTGSLLGTASFAVSASQAQNAVSASFASTASFVTLAQTASFVTLAQTASFVTTAQTASLALTASSADNFLVRGTLTAQTIVAQTITSSTDFVTGSTKFGTLTSNTHQFTGSVTVSGSLAANGSNVILTNQTSSMSVLSASFASTASYVENAQTASYVLNAVSASYAANADLLDGKDSSTFATTGSNVFRGNQTVTGSLFTSGSNTLVGSTILTGSLLVSGSTTQIGNNTLTGNTILSGSLLVSGSQGLPTATIGFFGDVDVTGTIGLLPVNKNIDTTLSGSYIYVSGSTQDLYFSQNSRGFSNTTRLRWLEGNLYTGLLNGGLITAATGSTTYQISSGSGIIVNLNASLNDNPYPTVQYLNWSNLSGSISAFTSSFQQAFVGIDSSGNIFAQGTPFSNGQFDTLINIGIVLFQNGSTINGVKTQPSVAYGFQQAQNIFNRAFGPLKLSGYTLAPSGSSVGSLIVGSGTAYAPGSNYTVDPNEPSYTIDNGTTTSKIFRYRQSGSTWVYDTNGGPGYASIDPTQYSNNGVLTAVPGTGINREWSIQRVFWFPNSVVKAIVVYYGNATYATEAEAIANISFESFVEAPNTAANAVYLGAIVVRNNADFTDNTSYKIQPGGLFRQVGGSGGGGSTVTQTLAGLSDVAISGQTSGQALVYDSTAAKWENKSFISASISGNAATATTASFASTASFVALAQTASFVQNAVSASFASTASFVQTAQTASYVLNAVSSSFASTASFVTLAQTASFVTLAQTASFVQTAQTASYVLNAVSSSFASTASSADNFLVRGTLTAQTIVAQTITSSTDFVTGSTRFGSLLTNTHEFTGSVSITGSLNAPSITGSLLGTASFANNATSASYALTSSNIEGGTANYLPLWLNNTKLTSSIVYQNNTGIGISDLVPTHKLQVNGDVSAYNSNSTLNSTKYAFLPALNVTTVGTETNQYANVGIYGALGFAATASTFTPQDNSFVSAFFGNVVKSGAGSVSGKMSSYAAGVNFSGTGNVTTVAGFRAYAPLQSFALPSFTGTLTNYIGLLIDDITGTTDIGSKITNKYGIFQSGSFDRNYFAGSTTFAGGITGSLEGTASYALTASYAMNGGGGGLSALYIQDEGVTQGTASYINFTGTGVTATVTAGTASISITGGGSSGTGQSVLFTQASPATTWTFSHNLNNQYVNYDVYDSNSNAIIPANVSASNANTLIITFGVATAGYAVATVGGGLPFISSSFNGYVLTASGSTAAWAPTSSLNALSASFASTASFVTLAQTASYILNAVSASHAVTASSADNFTVRGTLTAQTIVAQTVSSSIVYSSGSNIFGNNLANTQVLTGSVTVTGSLAVNGSNVILTNQTSSMSVLSASYASSSFQAINANLATNTSNIALLRDTTDTTLYPVFSAGTAADAYTTLRGNPSGALSYNATNFVLTLTSGSVVAPSFTGSLSGTASFAINTTSASFVNTLNQNVLITGSLTVGSGSIGASENTLTLGARDTAGEGGQLGLNASGGTYTSASMLDNYQNRFRVLRGNNAGSDAEIASFNMHNGQAVFNRYTGSGAFPGTATANLAVDSSGNVITIPTGTVTSASFASTASFSNNFTVADTLTFASTLTDYASVASSIVGSNNLFTQNTGSYTSAFFKYTARNGSNTRAGEVISTWNGTSTAFTDFSTVDIGDTSAVTASISIVSGQAQFNIQTNSSGWNIKSIATFM